ncbi:hypothetical protein V6N11_061626 [Hibiscus sabdariffa]|uniref:Uncharacterized protein n=1 Tax=Hibiscus sabdariffa TaxID=183260 RepID=A0ABR2A3N5_9ROSI
MGSSTFPLFLCSLLLSLSIVALSQPPGVDVYLERICNETTGNYTANSTYEDNLNTIISRFSNLSEISNGFSNLSAGESGPDKVYSIALCRGEMNQPDCSSCLNYTATELKRACPFNKGRHRLVRKVFGAFNPVLSDLLDNLRKEAAAAGPLRKYAPGSALVGNQDTVYATMQCTPDMDQRNCDTCLTLAQTQLQNCCSGRYGCRVLRPTCVLRFESNNPFYNGSGTTIPQPFPPSSPPGGKGDGTTRTVIIVIASVVGVLILVFISICIFMRRRRNKPFPVKVETPPADGEISGIDSLQFNFDSVLLATDNFSIASKLGQGGFGAVYKGQLPNGREIAVKRLSRESGQGDREFKTEDETQGSTKTIVGTYGYMAPEYVINGQFSVKSDVFSFGVLLLEIISGQKNNCFRHGEDEEYILSFAWKSWKEGTALNLVDPTSWSSASISNKSNTEVLPLSRNEVSISELSAR